MTEEIKNSELTKEKNTVALVWMICSIVWLILLLTIIWLWFWIILLIIWFILWIIWLFYKPRGKARVAVIIPAIVWIAAIIGLVYVKNSIKTPASEFTTWIESISENEIYSDVLKSDEFDDLVSAEFENIIKSKSKDGFNKLYETSSWANAIEKWSYIFFDIMKESIENSLEKFGIESEALDEEINEEEIIDEENIDEEIDEEEIDEEDQDNEEEVKETETVEIFDNWEKDDIEEIINILE